RGAGIVNLDDRRAVRATQAVAAPGRHCAASAFEDPCGRLRRVRDQGGYARPDRSRDLAERSSERGTAVEAAGDRRAMPGTPDANLRDQYSHPACLMTSRRTGEGPYHAVTVDVPEAPAGMPRETVGETPLELRSDSAPSRTSGLAARSSVVKSPEISR